MKRIFLFSALSVFSMKGFCRQVKCPTINATTSSYEIKEREPLTVTANVSGGSNDITYNWSISAGSITSGQGTSTITVDTQGLAGSSVTASVEIGGLSRECSSMSSVTTSVIANPEKVKPVKKAKTPKKKKV